MSTKHNNARSEFRWHFRWIVGVLCGVGGQLAAIVLWWVGLRIIPEDDHYRFEFFGILFVYGRGDPYLGGRVMLWVFIGVGTIAAIGAYLLVLKRIDRKQAP